MENKANTNILLMTDQNIIKTPAEKNIRDLKHKLHFSDHPHPATLCMIIIIFLIFIYYVYINLLKQCFSGVWYDQDGNKYYISHNKWSDSILVNQYVQGYVSGHAIYLRISGRFIRGVLHNNIIHWVGTPLTWQKAINIV